MKSLFTGLLFFVSFSFVQAQQAGMLDKSYGASHTGTVTVSTEFQISSSAIQKDNKLLLGGAGAASGQLVVLRHNADGSQDTSFGEGGKASINMLGLFANFTIVREISGCTGIAVQPDGKIVVTGSVDYNNTENNIYFDNDIVVARYLPDGTPDESFGSHGRVATELGYLETPNAITIQPDGKLVIAGEQTTDFYGNGSGVLLVRYNGDGSLDNSFGGGKGCVKYKTGATQANAVLVQPDGKLVAGGFSIGIPSSFFLVRYLPDGTLDATFGNSGAVKTTFPSIGGTTQIKSLALDYKGRIAAVGIIGSNEAIEVARYLPDGSLDNSFDGDGQLQLNFNGVSYFTADVSTILAQPDGQLVISSAITNSSTDFTVSQILSGLSEDGALDESFGVEGQTVANTGLTNDLNAPAVMQTEGKIIVSANNINYTTYINKYLLTRYYGYPQKVSLLVRIKRWLQNHTLTWKGLPVEDKIAYYTVEQSSNSSKGFTPVAKVSGVSNLKEYSITNSHLLPGANYYRIKAVSTDGVVRYSEVVSADNMANTTSVYPNPAKNYVTVQGLQTDETANISIADGSGTIKVRGVSNGAAQYRFQIANLFPGTYYINITTGSKTETLKFVKE